MNEKTMNNQIQNLLTEVSQIIKTHEQHANKQGEKFNIFTILRVDRKEVETHSRFIYELLNPKGSHGQGNIFLKSFAKIVLDSKVSNTAIDPQREDSTTQNRRIDFTLETKQNIIGIEMKIDAGDQRHQLWDYQQELKGRAEKKWKNKNKTKLFYLSLKGKEASAKSLKARKKDDKNLTECATDEVDCYKRISFATEILDWINDCIKQSIEKSVLCEALIQYKILIEKLTGQNQDMNTEIIEQITKNTDNFKSALQIEKATTQAKINFQVEFWEELLEVLNLGSEEQGFYFGGEYKRKQGGNIAHICRRYYKGSRGNTHQGIVYDIENKKLKVMLIIYRNCYFRIKKDDNNKGVKEITNKDDINDQTDGFLYPCLDKKLNFGAFNDELIDMLSDEQKQKTINALAEEFKELVNKLEK